MNGSIEKAVVEFMEWEGLDFERFADGAFSFATRHDGDPFLAIVTVDEPKGHCAVVVEVFDGIHEEDIPRVAEFFCGVNTRVICGHFDLLFDEECVFGQANREGEVPKANTFVRPSVN